MLGHVTRDDRLDLLQRASRLGDAPRLAGHDLAQREPRRLRPDPSLDDPDQVTVEQGLDIMQSGLGASCRRGPHSELHRLTRVAQDDAVEPLAREVDAEHAQGRVRGIQGEPCQALGIGVHVWQVRANGRFMPPSLGTGFVHNE